MSTEFSLPTLTYGIVISLVGNEVDDFKSLHLDLIFFCLAPGASTLVCRAHNGELCRLLPHRLRGSARPPHPRASPRPDPTQSGVRCPSFVSSTPRDAPIACGQSVGSLCVARQNPFQSSMSSSISATFDRTER